MTSSRAVGFVAAVSLAALAALDAGCAQNGGPFATVRFGIRFLEREEFEFLRLINDYRGANGAGPLTSSAVINQAAYDHSLDMGVRAFFDHVNPDGIDPFQRMCAAGYVPACEGSAPMSENIAAGNESAADTFEQWQHSTTGHNENMLDPQWTVIGIGRALVEGSPNRWYWTTDFSTVLDQDGCACAGGAIDACVTASCGAGQRQCDDYCQWNECHVPAAGAEICDGYDNDCDGQTDEDVCGSCVPTPEVCDGADNDCDTVVDENRVCGPECTPVADTEDCNGNDDNCDGTIDEGCPCPAGTPARQCGMDAGRCTLGEQTCTGGTWSACTGAILPRRDICDGVDNDCDGTTDENACNVDTGGSDEGCGCSVVSAAATSSRLGLLGLLLGALLVRRHRRPRRGGDD
jgi:MYXO-CTERM domain-containing protein